MELNAMLRDLADEPAPPSTVSVSRAASTGRRTVRRRRLAAAGSTVLAVVAILAVLNMVLAKPRAAVPVGPTPTPTATVPVAPTDFDPMVRYAEAGWLPDGADSVATTTSHDWFYIEALYFGPGNPPSSTVLDVIVVPAGHGVDPANSSDYAVPVQAMPAGRDAPPVNGRPAQWVTAIGGAVALRWEYAPGAFAIVYQNGNGGQDEESTRDVLRRVAYAVRYGVDEQVRLPITTSAIPTGLRPRVVTVVRYSNGGWQAHVSYGTGDERPASGDWPLDILAMTRSEETGDGATIGNPTTTVDGHPARKSTLLDGGSGLQVYNVDGVYLELTTHSAQTTRTIGGGLVGLFRSIQIYPDPGQWK